MHLLGCESGLVLFSLGLIYSDAGRAVSVSMLAAAQE